MTIPLDVELIGLSGYAGAGKDTVASLLDAYQWRRASFADPLRAALYALDPDVFSEDEEHTTHRLQYLVDVYGWDYVKREFPDVRALLQRMGTEVGRDLFGTDFWVDRAFAGIEADGGTRYVFTDVRFRNEADAIKARGGQVWRITRPGFGAVNGHISETELDRYPFDVWLDNVSSIGGLQRKLEALLSSPAGTTAGGPTSTEGVTE